MTATDPSTHSAREQALEARLVELETRLSFQEHTIAELSDALAEARMEGARNTNLLRVLMEDLGKMRNALNSSDPAKRCPCVAVRRKSKIRLSPCVVGRPRNFST